MSFKKKNNSDLNQILAMSPKPSRGFGELDSDFFNRKHALVLDEMELLRQNKKPVSFFQYAAVASLVISIFAGIAFYISYSEKSNEHLQRVAIVLSVSGNAKVFANNDSGVTLKKGDAIREGQSIKTQANSIVDLSLPGGILVRVAPLSHYQLHTIDKINPGKIATRLNSGSIYNLVEKLSANEGYTVNTPTAIAGVRGTSFKVTANKGKTSVHLIRGSVYIKNTTKEKKPEYILDQYDKNYIEILPAKLLTHTRKTEDDFKDARQLDSLGKHLVNPEMQSLVLDKKGLDRARQTKKDRQQIYNIIRLRNGQKIRGMIISQNSGKMFVETKNKSLILLSNEVIEIKFVDSE